MLGLRPLQGPDVLRIDFIVPRLHLEDQELPRVLGLHLHPNLLLIQGLPALDNLGTRIPWMWHGLLLLLGSAIWRFPFGYPALLFVPDLLTHWQSGDRSCLYKTPETG